MEVEYIQPTGKWHRLVPSHFPTIDVFEDCYESAEDQEIAFEIESLTNDRLRHEAGELNLVPMEDRVFGAGATAVMAAFTHTGKPSRFTTGEWFGIYYAAQDVETAVLETMHHTAKFLSSTNEGDTELTMRCYTTKVEKPLIDIANGDHVKLHDPDNYLEAQKFAISARNENEWGIHYKSARNEDKNNIAILRPPAISKCTQAAHYRYRWSGHKQAFTGYFKVSELHLV